MDECQNCRHWKRGYLSRTSDGFGWTNHDQNGEPFRFGECRGVFPHVVAGDERPWPTTRDDDGCVEFMGKDEWP